MATQAAAKRKIIVGSDHGGFDLKQQMVAHLEEVHSDFEVVDVGCHSATRCDYPDIAQEVGTQVNADAQALGIVVCGSGIGISIAANKVTGIRCALVHDHYGATMCRRHNNANMIALGGRTTGVEVAKECVDAFLGTGFDGGRHAGRVEKMMAIREGKAE